MQNLLSHIKISVNPELYIKDPESSELGKKIIEHSIVLIDEIGFDQFTFKKLGERIHSNESSIYRYFESKHKLLIYLSCWYWTWIEYTLVLHTQNISDSTEKLNRAIATVTQTIKDDTTTPHINEALLSQIIIAEFSKTFLTKEVENENKKGFFLVYKTVIYRLIAIFEEINPNYPYSKTLASTIVEGALHQQYLKNHFKTITNCTEENDCTAFYCEMAKKLLL